MVPGSDIKGNDTAPEQVTGPEPVPVEVVEAELLDVRLPMVQWRRQWWSLIVDVDHGRGGDCGS